MSYKTTHATFIYVSFKSLIVSSNNPIHSSRCHGSPIVKMKPLNVVKCRLTVGQLKCDWDDLGRRLTRIANMILA
ncbi:hypothetical protein CR513_08037, partial [Mucuna pruriens]